jgi:hypothetical protein
MKEESKLPKELFDKTMYRRLGAMDEIGKYYTPEIEEFHVGFEYERCDDGYSWVKDVYPRATEHIKLENFLPYTRVKYLDREDIESLGFKHYNGLIYRKGNYEILHNFNSRLKNSITIRERFGDKWIDLAIFPAKNKSELKRILKQIGV